MKKVVLFALIAALCAGALLYIYLGKLENQKEVPVVYEDVVVAAADIPAYTQITDDMVTTRQVPQGASHPRAARTASDVVGFVTESEILEGEEMLPEKLKQPGKTDSGLSYVIPEGMRAVTVGVDEISGFAGFLQRGDYVDVFAFLTTNYETPEETALTDASGETTRQSQATTVLAAQNVCIAAVGSSLSDSSTAEDGDGEDAQYTSVTLLVTPEQAMRVIQGARDGVILLALRANGDRANVTLEPVVSDTLLQEAE